MALSGYLKLKGQTQGDIKGSITQKGREDMIEVIEFHHEVASPRDSATGQPTGKRQHMPLRIVKAVDKSSPMLYNALVHNENITEFEIQWWQPSPTGVEVQHYTHKLTNANVAFIKAFTPNNRDPNMTRFPHMEEVGFTYQKIEWTWMDGNITAEDDWETPVV